MSPQNAKIFHAEDDPEVRRLVEDLVSKQGHQVVLSADTLEAALARVPELARLGINVVILDDKLRHFNDGLQIAQAIVNLHPDMPVISLSTLATNYGIRHFDKQRLNKDKEGLVNFITRI